MNEYDTAMNLPPSGSPLVEVSDLSFTYFGQAQPALTVDRWAIHAGELVLLIGETGSGKSTLLNCLTGVSPEYTGGRLTGAIAYQGEDMTAWSIRERSQRLGIMLQNVEPQLFTDRVETEIQFGLENWNVPPTEIAALTEVALTDFDLKHRRDWLIRTLSAGQKQRLLLACLSTRQPHLLVLDEPFAFLDRAGVNQLLLLLRECLGRGQAVLIVEHRLELLRQLCAQVDGDRGRYSTYRLDGGRLHPGDLAAGPEKAAIVPAISLPEPGPAQPAMLRTQDLSWGGFPPFPDLEVTAGEVVLLRGDNGCGKTTLLRLLSGLLKPTTGQIYLGEQEVTCQGAVRRSRAIGFVLQNPNHQLFAESTLAEVHQAGVTEAQAHTWLTDLNLAHCAEKHPQALSQGQKRRLALGAVLARQPAICLLDEIMVGQDAQSLQVMLGVLQRFIGQGGTLIFTSHDPGVAEILQPRVVVLGNMEPSAWMEWVN